MSELSKQIDIDDIDTVIQYLEQKAQIHPIDIEEVINFIQTQPNTVFYLDRSFTGCEEKDALYCWLDTGYTIPSRNKTDRTCPLLISLYKYDNVFTGHFVGDPNFLSIKVQDFTHISERDRKQKVERFLDKYYRKIESRTIKHLTDKIESDKPQVQIKAQSDAPVARTEQVEKYWQEKQVLDITNEIEPLLLVNKWSSIHGLDRYIKVVGSRLHTLIEQKESQYYVLNNIQSAICNTGLLSKYGEDIYVMYRINLSYNLYMPYKVITDRHQYEEEGFSIEQSRQILEPISFSNDQKFCVDMSDVNINTHDLAHIIDERRSRFPDDLQNLSDLALVNQIKTSLEIGLKLQKRDGSFAKPYYSATSRSISWALPFFLNGDITTEPELILVMHKCGNFYQVKTVLPYDDDVKDRLMNMSLYSRLW